MSVSDSRSENSKIFEKRYFDKMSFDWTSLLGNNRLVMRNEKSQQVKDLTYVKVVGLYFSAHVRFFSVRALLRFRKDTLAITQQQQKTHTTTTKNTHIHSGALRVVNSHLDSQKFTKRSVTKDWVKCRCRWRSCSFPSDQNEKKFNEYLNEMPWSALTFADRGRMRQLMNKFSVRGIPSLVLLDGADWRATHDKQAARL